MSTHSLTFNNNNIDGQMVLRLKSKLPRGSYKIIAKETGFTYEYVAQDEYVWEEIEESDSGDESN